MAKSEHDLPKLTADQVNAHERFAWMEITVPGGVAWIVACDSRPNDDERVQIADEVRALVENTVR